MLTPDSQFKSELPWFPSNNFSNDSYILEAPHPKFHDEGRQLYYEIIYDTYAEWTAQLEGAILYKGMCLISAILACEEDAKEPI